jgi:hypothetical protein
MGYKAATRIKSGSKEDGFDFVERGDSVSEGDFDDWDDLVAAEAVVTDEEYDVRFPEHSAPNNQPSGTPSNLEQVEGTTLQAEGAEDGPSSDEEPEVHNPADPPKVENAGTGEGFEDEDEES